jgi:hypothetical protein
VTGLLRPIELPAEAKLLEGPKTGERLIEQAAIHRAGGRTWRRPNDDTWRTLGTGVDGLAEE